MSTDLTRAQTADELLRRSLERGRLGHAYLFVGESLAHLETVAVRLAQTVNCENPPICGAGGMAAAACLICRACRQIFERQHPDLTWIQPENRTRVISVHQIRELGRILSLRPRFARRKVAILAGADRLNAAAANAFLKTLEEPPVDSMLILLSTDPDKMMETILSRCLRLSFASGAVEVETTVGQWVIEFAGLAQSAPTDLLVRYRLLLELLQTLGRAREDIEARMTSASPLNRFPDAEAEQRERWEDELAASVEAQYRRLRADYLGGLLAWLRDIWVLTEGAGSEIVFLPRLIDVSKHVAARLSRAQAHQNLLIVERALRRLESNAQEALVLEVGLMQLKL